MVSKKTLLVFGLIYLCLLIVVIAMNPRVKTAYVVREKITTSGNSVSWQLWCWKDWDNGKTTKKYLGDQTLIGTTAVADKIELSNCRVK